jgi:phosphoribosyl-ATP pyrophosphohydrolase
MADFKAYTDFCKTTESLPDTVDVNLADFRMAMSVVAKGNELLDMIKKNAFYGKPFNRQKWQNVVGELNAAIASGAEASRKALNHPVPPVALEFDVRTAHAIIGINTEAGELVENMMEVVFDGKEFDAVNFGEEVGDLMWYTAVGLDATGQEFDQCLATNKAKLEARYNKGKFTSEDAINRDLDTEREILTDGVEATAVEPVVEKEPEPEVADAPEVKQENPDAESVESADVVTEPAPAKKSSRSRRGKKS